MAIFFLEYYIVNKHSYAIIFHRNFPAETGAPSAHPFLSNHTESTFSCTSWTRKKRYAAYGNGAMKARTLNFENVGLPFFFVWTRRLCSMKTISRNWLNGRMSNRTFARGKVDFLETRICNLRGSVAAARADSKSLEPVITRSRLKPKPHCIPLLEQCERTRNLRISLREIFTAHTRSTTMPDEIPRGSRLVGRRPRLFAKRFNTCVLREHSHGKRISRGN